MFKWLARKARRPGYFVTFSAVIPAKPDSKSQIGKIIPIAIKGCGMWDIRKFTGFRIPYFY
jgi:hypothetical protein